MHLVVIGTCELKGHNLRPRYKHTQMLCFISLLRKKTADCLVHCHSFVPLVHFVRVCLLLQFVNSLISFTFICSFVRPSVRPSVRSSVCSFQFVRSFVRFASLVDGRLVMLSSYNTWLFSHASGRTSDNSLSVVDHL